jgi:predicted amidohydrolase
MPNAVKVAAVQLAAQAIDAAESVWPRLERWTRHAAVAGCKLVVFPECSYPAYVLGSAERARADDIRPQPVVLKRFSALARENRITLVAGFVADSGGQLWNAAGIWDASGRLLGVQHKTFLFDCDNRWFSHGTSIRPIETGLGRIGVVICADARAPEVSATLVNRGAELIVVPTAWVNMAHEPGEFWNVQPDVLIRARATEFGVPYVCADKCGREGPMEYVGQSQIVAADGTVLTMAGSTSEACIIAEVSPGPGSLAPFDSGLLRILNGRYRGPLPEIRVDGADIRRMSVEQLRTYHAIRAAALEGTRLVVLPEIEQCDIPLVRTRAAENRIFVAAGRGGSTLIAHPDGRATISNKPPRQAVDDLRAADNKHVTPETHIFEQRRPELYQLAPDAQPGSEPRP